jgi:hypothetical protein
MSTNVLSTRKMYQTSNQISQNTFFPHINLITSRFLYIYIYAINNFFYNPSLPVLSCFFTLKNSKCPLFPCHIRGHSVEPVTQVFEILIPIMKFAYTTIMIVHTGGKTIIMLLVLTQHVLCYACNISPTAAC